MGYFEHFFVNVEVVVVNPNVVEISASSKKHTFSYDIPNKNVFKTDEVCEIIWFLNKILQIFHTT